MPEIRSKEMEFLGGEASLWVDEGIITQEQADSILSLYDVKKRNLRLILMTAGVVLLGLGAVSFALAHWSELGKTLRVLMISGAYIASIIAYIFTGRSGTKTGRAFLLLSSAIFGGGIYLISRMYDYNLSFGEILGWWVTAVIITAIITRDSWQLCLAQVISLIWLNETDSFDALALYFARTARLPVTEFFAPVKAFALIAALWAAWIMIRDRPSFALNMMLTVLLLASRMSLCFGGTWTLIILAASGALMSFIPGQNDTQIMGLMMLGLFGLLLTWPDFWRGKTFAEYKNILPVVNAVIVAALMLVNIWRGHSGVGIIFCAMIASRYFFDHLFGYLPKAWGFTFTGIIFVIAGIFFGRIRKFIER